MTKLNDICLLIDLFSDQSEAHQGALYRVLLGDPQGPPGPLWAALGASLRLAHQISETGSRSDWQGQLAPEAAGKLLFRLTKAVEEIAAAFEVPHPTEDEDEEVVSIECADPATTDFLGLERKMRKEFEEAIIQAIAIALHDLWSMQARIIHNPNHPKSLDEISHLQEMIEREQWFLPWGGLPKAEQKRHLLSASYLYNHAIKPLTEGEL